MLRPGNLTVVRIDPDASLFHVVSNDDSLEIEEHTLLLLLASIVKSISITFL